MPQCLFCPNTVDSREHVFSDWILKEIKPSEPIHIKIAKRTSKWVNNREMRVKCVCHYCNNGWMSDLESANQQHMRAMIHDESIALKPAQLKLLALWITLKAMVLDGSSNLRIPFYSQPERQGIKPSSPSVPIGTTAWIGRLSSSQFHAGLTDTFGDISNVPKAFRGCVTTIVVGHLVIQVVTMHVIPIFATRRMIPNYKSGAWDVNLLDIWPIFGDVTWPPALSFTLEGNDSIGRLVNRWKIGADIT
jgi:hypothetical protein